jgi:hypothetical protein
MTEKQLLNETFEHLSGIVQVQIEQFNELAGRKDLAFKSHLQVNYIATAVNIMGTLEVMMEKMPKGYFAVATEEYCSKFHKIYGEMKAEMERLRASGAAIDLSRDENRKHTCSHDHIVES